MSLGLMTSSLRVFKNLKNVEYDKVLGLVSARLVNTDGDFSHILERKSRLQLVLLSCAVCGIEFCYAAETAFVSPTLLKIGVPVLYMTLIWCLSPFLGFILVPLLGSLSDRCGSPLGRRRPFILLLSAGIIIGLLLVPNGKDIGVLLGDEYPAIYPGFANYSVVSNSSLDLFGPSGYNTTDRGSMRTLWKLYNKPHPWSIVFTVIGVILLDFSCDACQSPCRAYLLDVTVPADHPAGLTTFTVMAGLGGALGYVMGGVSWESTSIGETLGDHVRIVFSLVLVIYIVCVLLTISAIKEVPLSKLGINKEDLQKSKKKVHGAKYKKFANESDSEEEIGEAQREAVNYGSHDQSTINMYQSHDPPGFPNGTVTNSAKPDGTYSQAGITPENKEELELYQSTDGQTQNLDDGLPKALEPLPPLTTEVSLKTYLVSIVRMPRSLAILCLTNLFCWMSLVCYSLYFTDFVGQAVYGGDPLAPPNTEEHELYERGVRVGSMAMSLYSLSCAAYSLSLEKLVKKFRAKPVYIISQLVYTVGALLMAATCNKVLVILLSPCAGIMYATLFTMPYLLVAHYHSTETFDESGSGQKGMTEHQIRGLGTDIALVSSMVFVAQFLLSACMGSIIHATGTTASIMVAASILSFLGSMAATQVLYLDL